MKYLFSIFFITVAHIAFSQNGITRAGSRAAGMGYATSTISDSWSLFNNPGGLGNLHETTGMFSFENRYLVEGFNTAAAGVVTALPIGSVGISVFRFGDDLYHEQTAALSYGNRFGMASLGVRINYLRYHVDGYGNKGIIALDFGGIAEVTETLYFGAYIRNINQAEVSEANEERAPTLLSAGLSYRPTEKVIVNLEAEKNIDYKASFRTGVEYVFYKKFVGRTGISTKPFINYFGLGFRTTRLHIDYALARDIVLGNSHQVAVAYQFSKE